MIFFLNSSYSLLYILWILWSDSNKYEMIFGEDFSDFFSFGYIVLRVIWRHVLVSSLSAGESYLNLIILHSSRCFRSLWLLLLLLLLCLSHLPRLRCFR